MYIGEVKIVLKNVQETKRIQRLDLDMDNVRLRMIKLFVHVLEHGKGKIVLVRQNILVVVMVNVHPMVLVLVLIQIHRKSILRVLHVNVVRNIGLVKLVNCVAIHLRNTFQIWKR